MRRHFHHILTLIAAVAMAAACSPGELAPHGDAVYYYPDGSDSSYNNNNNNNNNSSGNSGDSDDPDDPNHHGGMDGSPYINEPYSPSKDGYYTAVVTVKADESGQVYLWFANRDRLDPLVDVPYEHQYRAIASLRQRSAIENGCAPVDVDWLEPVEDGIFTTDTSVAGSDGIDIKLDSWITTSDDGYLTLHYMTTWGQHPVHYDFYLVSGTDPADPYTLELRHNANGDRKEEAGEGIINFDINSLPDTGDSSVYITLKWTNNVGIAQKANFGFKTRK